jgi:hypothetical protein
MRLISDVILWGRPSAPGIAGGKSRGIGGGASGEIVGGALNEQGLTASSFLNAILSYV